MLATAVGCGKSETERAADRVGRRSSGDDQAVTTDQKHICIIGGGVIGLCTAYYCARKGQQVTVLDRETEVREGCSYGNAGMIVPSHFVPLAAPGMVAMGFRMMWNPESPFYIKPRLDRDLFGWGMKFIRAANSRHVARSAPLLRDLGFASRACFEDLEASFTSATTSTRVESAIRNPQSAMESGFGLVQRGLLMLCLTQHALDEEAKYAARANELGVAAEILDAKQTSQLDPGARLDIAGSVLFPKDCHLSPNRFMAALKAKCHELGVTFRWGQEVTGLNAQGSRIGAVVVGGGPVEADEFVLCGGAWSPSLAQSLGLKLPMQAGKGYSLTLPQPRQLPRLCHILSEARVAVTPMGDALRFGGTMEIAGLNEDINPVRVNGIVKSSLKYYPEFQMADFDGVKPWCGLRPCSPDGLPYLGRSAKFKNLTLATGHAMMGLSLGPITGKLVSELITGEKPFLDLKLLDPDRYA